MGILTNIEYAAQKIDRAIVMYSTGADSTVMLDLCHRFMPGRFEAVFLYTCPALSFQDRVIEHYQRRYGITIHQFPHPRVQHWANDFMRGKRRVTFTDAENHVRETLGIDYVGYGYLSRDSLARRGICSLNNKDGTKEGEYGVSFRFHRFYPLADWSKSQVMAYIKERKLMLPVTYKLGFRDLTDFTEEGIELLYNQFPEDYRKVAEKFPRVEAERVRMMEF